MFVRFGRQSTRVFRSNPGRQQSATAVHLEVSRKKGWKAALSHELLTSLRDNHRANNQNIALRVKTVEDPKNHKLTKAATLTEWIRSCRLCYRREFVCPTRPAFSKSYKLLYKLHTTSCLMSWITRQPCRYLKQNCGGRSWKR